MRRLGICIIYKDEGCYLEEWLDWHLGKLKFNHVYIYDNRSGTPASEFIPGRYRKLCTIIPWDYGPEDCRPHSVQYCAYNDCLKSYGRLFDWIAFIDVDEFVNLVGGCPDMSSFLDDLSLRCQNYNLVGAVALGWIVYGSDGHVAKSSDPVRLRFRRLVNIYPVELPQCKCIVRPSRVHSMTAHFPVLNPSYLVINSVVSVRSA